jgi:hypothetical protein
VAKKRKAPDEEKEEDLPFPLEGLDETRSYLRQRPGTTAQAVNVRTFEPGTDRARGGARPGLARYFPTAPAAFPIQDANFLVTTKSVQTLGSSGEFLYGQVSGVGGFGLGADLTGASLVSGLGTTSNYQLSCSCWDSLGNIYVAQVRPTGTTCRIYAYTSAGNLVSGTWGAGSGFITLPIANTTHGICGMCIDPTGTYLFIAVIANATYVYPSTATNYCYIYRYLTANGAASPGVWAQNGTAANVPFMFFSTASHNCLCCLGNSTTAFLGVECMGVTGSLSPTFHILNPYANALTVPVAPYGYVNYIDTPTANQSRVVSDGTTNFYTIASTSSRKIRQIVAATAVGSQITQGTTLCDNSTSGPLGLCYDASGSPSQLVAINAGLTTGAIQRISVQNFGVSLGVNNLSVAATEMDHDGVGNFVLWTNSVASNDVIGYNTTTGFGTPAWSVTLANTIHTGASVDKGSPVQTPGQGASRVITNIYVAGGTARLFTFGGPTTNITKGVGGSVFSSIAARTFSAQNGLNMFFVDGNGYYYYNSLQNAMLAWVTQTIPLNTATPPVPLDGAGKPARLICTWRGRTVLAGFLDDGQLVFMSAQSSPAVTGTGILAPFDFNTAGKERFP